MPILSIDLKFQCSGMLTRSEDDEYLKRIDRILILIKYHRHIYRIKLKSSINDILPINRDRSGVKPIDIYEFLGDIISTDWLESRIVAIAGLLPLLRSPAATPIPHRRSIFQICRRMARIIGHQSDQGVIFGRIVFKLRLTIFCARNSI